MVMEIRLIILFSSFLLSGCYYLEAARIQSEIWWNRGPIKSYLDRSDLNENERKKLLLALELLQYLKDDLQLNNHGNYEHYSKIHRPYVSYLLTASKKWSLEAKEWNYLLVGRLPYRGFRSEERALQEAKKLEKNDWETYVRPVSAYSTLGWFKDPILSTMISYDDAFFVETIIHEIIHTHIFLPNAADFNEAVATFLGNWGAQLFFEKRYPELQIANKIRNQLLEKIRFSRFIADEKKRLEQWYKMQEQRDENLRRKRLTEISEKCEQMKFKGCQDLNNNAKLMAYGTYYELVAQLSDLAEQRKDSFNSFLTWLKVETLTNKKSPNEILYQPQPKPKEW